MDNKGSEGMKVILATFIIIWIILIIEAIFFTKYEDEL
tara:strand:+ start:3717 stop:3830 length:114 start_codon:yes stop_codon:yes gene_type:complete